MLFLRFFLFAVTYMMCAIGFSFQVRSGDTLAALASLWPGTSDDRMDPRLVLLLLAGSAVLYFMSGRQRALARDTHLAILGTGIFLASFSLAKSAMPLAVPFHADPVLAELDRALHFGTDPWRIAHVFAPWINPTFAAVFYVTVWTVFSTAFPLFLALADRNEARRTRYIVLFFFVWVVLGNLIAISLMSAGPVFYDRLFADTAFVDLHAALASSGVDASGVGSVREFLWMNHIENRSELGSGISAFPSVHVAMATLIALYVAERWRHAAPLGLLYLITVLFMSVYLGWHYAVDGYFSILAVVAAAFALRRIGSRAAFRARSDDRT